MTSSAIIYNDGKFLMVKQQKRGRIFWNFPGGHLEDGESPEEACIREVKEETGLDEVIKSKMHQTDKKSIFLVNIISGVMQKEEGLLDIDWIGPEEHDKWDSKSEEIKQIILKLL